MQNDHLKYLKIKIISHRVGLLKLASLCIKSIVTWYGLEAPGVWAKDLIPNIGTSAIVCSHFIVI